MRTTVSFAAVAAITTVAHAQAPSPPPSSAGLSLRVHVTDSLITQRPLPAAEVALASAQVSRVATTAPDGRATFDSLPPGMYRVTFWHPDLDRIGVSGAVSIVAVQRDTFIALTTPPAADVRAALCGAPAQGTVVIGTLTRNAQPWRAKASGVAPGLRSVSAAGRPVVEVSVEWRGDSAQVAGSALEPPAQLLAPSRVVGIADAGPGGFDRRRLQAKGGRFLTAEDIMLRRPISTTDALRAVLGVTVLPWCGGMCSRVLLGRSIGGRGAEGQLCQPVMFLDGTRIAEPSGPQPHPFDVLLTPGEAYGIEIYPGPASAPPEFASKGTECGVILVWTKRGR